MRYLIYAPGILSLIFAVLCVEGTSFTLFILAIIFGIAGVILAYLGGDRMDDF